MQTISIHTSAREVTIWGKGCSDESDISIHTSAREVTKPMERIVEQLEISIHTSAREVTNPLTYGSHFPPNFNPHFRKGSDLFPLCLPQKSHHFNPHFRKGSDCNIPQKHLSIFMKYLYIYLNLLSYTIEILCLYKKHIQICLFLQVRVSR